MQPKSNQLADALELKWDISVTPYTIEQLRELISDLQEIEQEHTKELT